jgi:uncharacterized protein (DUF362 family)
MTARVAVVKLDETRYPRCAPFHPSEAYPEYPWGGRWLGDANAVYAGVRRALQLLGLDRAHIGTRQWNPLGNLIEPGMRVVIKPNFVVSRHRDGKDVFAIITHASVIRAVLDYVALALRNEGRVIVADGPQYDCNWQELLEATQLPGVLDFYANCPRLSVELIDLRPYWSRHRHFASQLEPLPGDPAGSLVIDLGRRSALYGKACPEKLYGAVYHRDETIAHHHGEVHEYCVSRTVMEADVVVSVPKLKVHKKVGVTLNAKGLVGICTNKNYLVHYTLTPPADGGDQYPDGLFTPMEEAIIRTERWMYDHLLAPRRLPLEMLHRSIYWLHNHTTRRLGIKVDEQKRQLDAGNWYGNDSAWRMTVDLMRLFHFADRQGNLRPTQQRRAFSVIDGVVGGEGNGPLLPDPAAAGVVLAGENLLAVDLVATRLMGFDPLKVPMHRALLADPEFDFGIREVGDIEVLASEPRWSNCLHDRQDRFLGFVPHRGWVGHLEVGYQEVTHG